MATEIVPVPEGRLDDVGDLFMSHGATPRVLVYGVRRAAIGVPGGMG